MALELTDARRHVGLNTIELAGCADHSDLVDNGAEDLHGFKIYRSHGENYSTQLFICPNRWEHPNSLAWTRRGYPSYPRSPSRPSASLRAQPWRWRWELAGSL